MAATRLYAALCAIAVLLFAYSFVFTSEARATATLCAKKENSSSWKQLKTVDTDRPNDPDFIQPEKMAHSVKICPSLFRVGYHGEHSPIIFSRQDTPVDLLICRVPKVGTELTRRISLAFSDNITFDANSTATTERPESSLSWKKMTPERFHHFAYSSGDSKPVKRIMFVRHPVVRLMSGIFEAARGIFTKKLGRAKDEVKGLSDMQLLSDFIYHKDGLTKDYQQDCWKWKNGEPSKTLGQVPHHVNISMNGYKQHWAPPQHCRCGMVECGMEFEYFHLERIPSIQYVLKQYLSPNTFPRWLPPIEEKVHGRTNGLNRYAQIAQNATILQFLNELTRTEQEHFGYLPITMEHIQNGTAPLITDEV